MKSLLTLILINLILIQTLSSANDTNNISQENITTTVANNSTILVNDTNANENLNKTNESEIINEIIQIDQNDPYLDEEIRYEQEAYKDISFVNDSLHHSIDPEKEKLLNEWTTKIRDFEAAEIISIKIPQGESEVYKSLNRLYMK
jgi:hypothetical protein